MVLVGTSYLGQAVTFVLAFLLRRVLGPEGMGYVAIAQLAMSYAPYVGLGSLQVAEREVALARGRNDLSGADSMEFASTSLALSIAAVVALGAVAIGAANWAAGSTLRGATFAVIGVVVLSQQYGIWATLHLRTRYRFATLGWAAAGGAIALSSMTLVGAIAFGPSGALAGAALGSVMQSAVLAMAARLPRWRAPHWTVVARMARLAPGFLALGLTAVVLGTVDQVAVGGLIGSTALGLYSAAYLGNGFVLRVPTLLNAVMYPRLQSELGATADRTRVYGMTRRTTGVSLVVIPLAVAAFAIILPEAVRQFLPAYADAIMAMRFLLAGVIGLAIGMPSMQFAITLNRQWVVVAITATALALMAGAYLLAHAFGTLTIGTAAVVDAVGYFAYSLALMAVGGTLAGESRWWPFASWTGAALMAAELTAVGNWADSTWGSTATMLGSLIAVLSQTALFGATWAALIAVLLTRDPQARKDLLTITEPLRRRLRLL